MIKDYKPAYTEGSTDYYLLFYTDRSGGLAFPCDESGNLLPGLQAPAIRNYKYAISHPEKYPYLFNYIEKRTCRHRNPATGVCKCGERIELYNDYMGARECPNCGQWWNLFGEELNDVSTWRHGEDW